MGVDRQLFVGVIELFGKFHFSHFVCQLEQHDWHHKIRIKQKKKKQKKSELFVYSGQEEKQAVY